MVNVMRGQVADLAAAIGPVPAMQARRWRVQAAGSVLWTAHTAAGDIACVAGLWPVQDDDHFAWEAWAVIRPAAGGDGASLVRAMRRTLDGVTGAIGMMVRPVSTAPRLARVLGFRPLPETWEWAGEVHQRWIRDGGASWAQ